MSFNNEYLAMFVSCILAGFLAGFAFDVCRALRVGLRLKRLIPFMDCVFWIAVLCIIYGVLFAGGDGQLRGFCMGGVLGGALLYVLCFSKIICPWMVISVRTVRMIIGKIIKPIFTGIGWIYTKIATFVQNIQKNIKNFGKKTLEKSEKNSII